MGNKSILVCFSLGLAAAGCSKPPAPVATPTDPYANRLSPPKYQLRAEGDRLYVDYDGKTFDIVKGSDKGPKESWTSRGELVLNDGIGEAKWKNEDTVMATVWSPKYRKFYIVANQFENSVEEAHPENDRCRLWSWDHKQGFKKLLEWKGQMFALDGSPCEMRISADGEFISFKVIDDKPEVAIFSIATGQGRRYQVPWEHEWRWNGFSVLDQTHVFVSGSPAKVYNVKTKKLTPVAVKGGLYPLVNFNGQTWTISYVEGEYRVVRLNHDLTRTEESVEFPRGFRNPGAPRDYLDGGD